MKYNEKLKLCPVCKKAHGISKKDIHTVKAVCKNCGTRLSANYFALVLIIILLCFWGWMIMERRYNIYSIYRKFYEFYACVGWIPALTSFWISQYFPLSRYRNYWAEFWDKGL